MSRRLPRRQSGSGSGKPKGASQRPDPRRAARPANGHAASNGSDVLDGPVMPAAAPIEQPSAADVPPEHVVPPALHVTPGRSAPDGSPLGAPEAVDVPAHHGHAHPTPLAPDAGVPTVPTGGTERLFVHDAGASGCTAAQLRRFIKSRPYVPMHELRRRFELNGTADDVTPIDTPEGTVYIGLPPRESGLLGELVRQGDVGLELCRDPYVPMVVGVFAIRPISRQ
jgi:hypothetical protein